MSLVELAAAIGIGAGAAGATATGVGVGAGIAGFEGVVVGAGIGAEAVGAGLGAGAFASITEGITAAGLLNSASLAWSIGSSLYSAFGQSSGFAGPRLTNVHVQTADFGQPIKRFWGIDKMAGTLVWIGSDGKGGRGIRAHKQDLGGKGKGGAAAFFYTYDCDFAVLVHGRSLSDQEGVGGVVRIWAGSRLIYDVSADATLQTRVGTGIKLKGQKGRVTFYNGNEDQEPPALIEALEGVGNTTAYRNVFLAVFEKFDVTDYRQIPQLTFECFADGTETYQQAAVYSLDTLGPRADSAAKQISWSYVDPNGEIIALLGVQNHGYAEIVDDQHLLSYVRMTAEGTTLSEERIPFTLASDDDNTTEAMVGGNLAVGIADRPIFLAGSGDRVWILEPEEPIVTITGSPPGEMYAVKENDLYLLNGGGWVRGFWKVHRSSGITLAVSDNTLYDTYGTFNNICVGDEFVWLLRAAARNAFGTYTRSCKLVKCDPETLDVVGEIDLGNIVASSFFVESDNDIKLIGSDSLGVHFFEYTDGELTELGLAPVAEISGGTGLGGVLYVRNGLWYTGNKGLWGFFDTDIRVWGPGVVARCAPLSTIVRDICIAARFDEDDIDVTELTDCVRGYTLDSQMTGRDAILPLQRYGFFDGREKDLTLDFIKRGHDPVATIPESDMATRPSLDSPLPDALGQERAQETELPEVVAVRFKDQDANYETGMALSSRLTTESKNVIAVDVAVVMTADKAKQIAEVLAANLWLERAPKTVLVPRKYLLLDAADPVTLQVAA